MQKEEGELGRQQISQYTRYLTLGWALILSTGVAFILVKPVVFNWNLILALKIIFSLTTGSMLSMWFAELITQEKSWKWFFDGNIYKYYWWSSC